MISEQEWYLTCPYCFQSISMLLDTSVPGTQKYIEDCEVCCRPIEITYSSDGETILSFDCHGAVSG